jgi:hypothetical protein
MIEQVWRVFQEVSWWNPTPNYVPAFVGGKVEALFGLKEKTMRTSINKVVLILLFTGLLIGAISTNVRATDYFPLKSGNVWVYYPSAGKGYRVDSIVGTDLVGLTETFIWKRLEAPPDNYEERRWLINDGVNLEALQFWANQENPQLASPVVLSPPWILDNLESPSIGNTWQTQLMDGTTTYMSTFWVESLAATIKVPAGTFYNCIQVRQLDVTTVSGLTKSYSYRRYWLAAGVGPVRYAQYNKNWKRITNDQRLVAYSLE